MMPVKPRNPIANQLRAGPNQQKIIPNKKSRKSKLTKSVILDEVLDE